MKFTDYEYQRPDIESFKEQFKQQISAFSSADSMEQQIAAMEAINALRSELDSM